MKRLVELGILACLVVASASCVTTRGLARDRASSEFGCPEDQVTIVQRPELSPGTYDVQACGHRARNTCMILDNVPRSTCTREPLETASNGR